MAGVTFTRQLGFGKLGESKIAAWLRAMGYHVLPVYEKEIHEGKGPTVFRAGGGVLIAPDLLVFNATKVRWVEAKHKSVFSWHRMTGRWVTGIDFRHYADYLQVRDLSPWPVWLMFLHVQSRTGEWPYDCPTGLFGGELLYLQKHENHRSDKWGKSGMVYWAHETLKLLAALPDIEAAYMRATTPTSVFVTASS